MRYAGDKDEGKVKTDYKKMRTVNREKQKNTDFFHSIVFRDYGGRDYRCNSF